MGRKGQTLGWTAGSDVVGARTWKGSSWRESGGRASELRRGGDVQRVVGAEGRKAGAGTSSRPGERGDGEQGRWAREG